MARVYAIASAKGGVGKTTTTANLGVALAAAGHRVAVVDADVGMPNLGRTLGLPSDPDGPTVHDVLAGEATPSEAVFEGPHGLGVVPGSTSLDAYASADPRELRGVLDAVADDGYDLVLLDTGAGLSHDTVLPLGLADAVLLVSTPSPDALGDTDRTRQLADRVGARVAGLVLTRVDAARTDPDAVASELGLDLVGVVPEDPAVDDATADGEPIVTRDVDAPVAAAYRTLAGAVAADALGEPFDEAAGVGSDNPDGSSADAVDGIDVASALGNDADDLDTAFDLDGGAGSTSDGPDDPDGTETGDDGPSSDDPETAGDAERATDEGTGVDTAARVGSDAGLASTLTDVEAGAGDESGTGTPDEKRDDAGDATSDTADADEADPVPVADAVDEAEPDAEDGVTFGTAADAPGSDGTDVTIQPDDAPDIPDAEAEAVSEPDRTAKGEQSPEADGVEDAANAGETPNDDDGSDGTDVERKGLFGRFFG